MNANYPVSSTNNSQHAAATYFSLFVAFITERKNLYKYCLFTCCILAHAATMAGTADDIFATDLTSLPQACELTGKFSQAKSLPGFEAPIVAKGDFFYSCTRGLIWRTTAPMTEAYIYPINKSAAKINIGNTFATINSRAQKHMGGILNNLIGGNREYLKKTFKITALGETLALTPRKKRVRKFINAINILRMDNGARITMFQGNGEKVVLDIVNPEEHQKLNIEDCTKRYAFSSASCQYLFE